jgi:hypothetical protein
MATKVPVELWQDPQGDVVLEWTARECRVYFECWVSPGVRAPYVGELTFREPLAIRGELSEFPPYQSSGDVGPSYLLEVAGSEWLAELRTRQRRAYGRRAAALNPDLRHLVVVGHDNNVEVLCTGFDVRRIPPDEAGHVRFR